MLKASPNLLDRSVPSLSLSKTTALQNSVDHCVGRFAEGVTDLKSIAALSAGAAAYRLGRLGAFSSGFKVLGETPLRTLSFALGLSSEVTSFELAHRSFQGGSSDGNLWRWNGSGGLREGLLQSLLTFSALKGAGRITQGENIV